jgi:hypothetical protein
MHIVHYSNLFRNLTKIFWVVFLSFHSGLVFSIHSVADSDSDSDGYSDNLDDLAGSDKCEVKKPMSLILTSVASIAASNSCARSSCK